jgi:hypothetical protein
MGIASATPLPAPALSAPANGADVPNPVTISWAAVTGAAGYVIRVAHDAGFTIFVANRVVHDTSVVLPEIAAGDVIYWQVATQYVDKDANTVHGDFSSSWNFTVTKPAWTAPTQTAPADASTPTAPVTFRWTSVPTATGYIVQVAKETGFGMLVFHPVTTADLSATWNDPPPGKYYWRVRAVPPDGSPKAVWSPAWSFTIAPTLAAPTLVSPSDDATGVALPPTLEWDAVTGADSYWLQVAADDSFSNTSIAWSGPVGNVTSKELKGLPAACDGLTLHWRVKACGGGVCGPYSDDWTFTTVAAPH